jgi:hypothetical protein
MPRPTSSTTLQRPDLGALAYEYLIDAPNRGFVGLEAMPIFEVPEQSADYPILPIEALIKTKDTRRAPRGQYNRGDWEFETATYSCEEHGWEEPIDDAEANLYSRYFDAEMIATEIAVDSILRNHEVRVAALLQANAITADVGTAWNTSSTCTPRANIETAREAMRAGYGILPNAVVMSYKVFRTVLNSTELKSALQYTNPIEVGSEEAQRRILGQYFGLDVLVGSGQRDGAKKGQAYSLADIWDDESVHLIRRSDGSQRLREPVYGRTFLWFGDSPQSVVVETYREEDKRSTIVRARQNVDEAIIFAGAAYRLGNIIHP